VAVIRTVLLAASLAVVCGTAMGLLLTGSPRALATALYRFAEAWRHGSWTRRIATLGLPPVLLLAASGVLVLLGHPPALATVIILLGPALALGLCAPARHARH
jgi:hypothetical protein